MYGFVSASGTKFDSLIQKTVNSNLKMTEQFRQNYYLELPDCFDYSDKFVS